MKFVYSYRTKDNEPHKGVVNAADRQAAFAALKAQGIRPMQMEEAPGFWNKLLGRGKRWMAIFVLAVIAVAFAWLHFSATDELQVAPRQQIYGDPVLIRELSNDSWAAVFADPFDRYLASFAEPGKPSSYVVSDGSLPEPNLAMLEERPDDVDVANLMRRIVNGMKRELACYLSDGGTYEEYCRELKIRQRAEQEVYDEAVRSMKGQLDAAVWSETNKRLLALGLPMIEPPEPK